MGSADAFLKVTHCPALLWPTVVAANTKASGVAETGGIPLAWSAKVLTVRPVSTTDNTPVCIVSLTDVKVIVITQDARGSALCDRHVFP